MKVAELVFKEIEPLFSNTDIRLVDVEYVKKNDGMHLVIYIDKQDAITIDDCVFVNNLIDETLETLNPTDDKPYILDVSSYGLDKPLKFSWQFDKYLNQKVDVKLYRKIDNMKEFSAILKNYSDKDFTFDLDGQLCTISRVDIAYITPYIDFN